jgi:cytochrome c biogenesis protein CcmG, thiol:disulfide interchange protein DsbE
MKNVLSVTIIILFFAINVTAQSAGAKKIPSVTLKTLDGKTFNSSQIDNKGKPIIISFWASWCRPCIKELTAISDLYEDWQAETGVKIYAISIDDARTTNNVRPLVNARGWEYEFLLDPNQDFKRAMGVIDVPHLFILNGKGEIVYQHTSYTEGSEKELFKKLKELTSK